MKQKIIFSTLALLLFGMLNSFGQNKVKGKVVAKDGSAVAGVNVVVKGEKKATQTDFDGQFLIDAKSGSVLVFTFVGFVEKEVIVGGNTDLEVVLNPNDTQLEEIVLLGSRNSKRTVTESAVPIDVIEMKSIVTQGAQVNLNQILNMVAPSFTSNTQTVADGTDHLDPAQLRGLGPDQVLVLVNGKRRHTSALVNINGTPGRGAVGTDMNAFPAFAVEKIEVLRDGASAQYGSDAIAGVINIKAKKATNKFDIALFGGSNFSKNANNHKGGNDGNNVQLDMNYGFHLTKNEKSFLNMTLSLQMRDYTSRAKDVTGTLFNGYNAVEQRAANAGVNLSSLFGNTLNTTPGFYNGLLNTINTYASQVSYFTPTQLATISSAATGASPTALADMRAALSVDVTENELAYRGLTRSDFNMRVGQSSLKSAQFFANSLLPVSEKVDFYAFGGVSNRTGDAAGFYRRPNSARGNSAKYLNGYLPEIHSTIRDVSVAAGFRGKIFNDWNFDLSNTFGKNTFGYNIENTSNATLKNLSKSEFDAGSLSFYQNTSNLDLSKKFDVLEGINFAFGGELRQENFKINPGEPNSYLSYDINGNVASGLPADNGIRSSDFFGAINPGGSQVFPGFREANRTDAGRQSYAAYADVELDVTKQWLINGAVRHENFNDFGKTNNFKVATRYKVTKNINVRGAYSTGFRAPSLHQINFNSTATQFVGGVAFEVGTFGNTSIAADKLGIPKLKQEESESISFGFTAKIPEAKLTLTVDAYQINIKDRVVLTDQFSRPTGPSVSIPGTPAYILDQQFIQANANAATFFANAIDTRSKGIDVVITHKIEIGKGLTLKSDLAATFSQTRQVGDIKGSPLLIANGQINRYYSEASRIYLEEAIPRVKANLSNSLIYKKFDFFLRNVYFGEVTDPNTADVDGNGFIDAKVVNGQAIETEHPIWGAKIITDFSVAYEVFKNAKLVIGANNIFDIYPDLNLGPISARRPNGVDASGNVTYATTAAVVDLSNANQFVYSRNVSQFGQNGRFVFARVTYNF